MSTREDLASQLTEERMSDRERSSAAFAARAAMRAGRDYEHAFRQLVAAWGHKADVPELLAAAGY